MFKLVRPLTRTTKLLSLGKRFINDKQKYPNFPTAYLEKLDSIKQSIEDDFRVIDLRELEFQHFKHNEENFIRNVYQSYESEISISKLLAVDKQIGFDEYPRLFLDAFFEKSSNNYKEVHLAEIVPEMHNHRTIDGYLENHHSKVLHHLVFLCLNFEKIKNDRLFQKLILQIGGLCDFESEIHDKPKFINRCRLTIYSCVEKIMKEARIEDIFNTCKLLEKKCLEPLDSKEVPKDKKIYDPDSDLRELLIDYKQVEMKQNTNNNYHYRKLYYVMTAFANYSTHKNDKKFVSIVLPPVPLFNHNEEISDECKEYIEYHFACMRGDTKMSNIKKLCESFEKKCLELTHKNKNNI
jgi:hypothetical protein